MLMNNYFGSWFWLGEFETESKIAKKIAKKIVQKK